MLQKDKPGDYVLATNETHTVREFLTLAFKAAGVELRFEGTGVDEKAYDVKTGKLMADVNPKFFRPAEVDLLWGDCTKAEKELGWKRDVSFEGLVKMMVEADLKEAGVK